jgi:tRNA(Ile)-lysidine synthase TilS/MesJ
MANELTPCQIAERSLIKKYRKTLWNPFIAAIKRYELVAPGDRIAVCISGGKDSMILAKLMQELQRHTNHPFELVFLVMDPGYNPENRRLLEENARRLEIPITVYESNIFEVTTVVDRNPCYLCAKMRRGFLYAKAQELGCNKIALGHHLSDVIETTLLGLFYGAQMQSMPPKLHSKNFPGMELIRPLYCVNEEAILAWKNYNGLRFLQCACRFTEARDAAEDGVGTSKRQEMKLLIRKLRETNPNIEKSIFAAIHDVQLDTLPGCKFHGKRYSLLDYYDLLGQPTEEDEHFLRFDEKVQKKEK